MTQAGREGLGGGQFKPGSNRVNHKVYLNLDNFFDSVRRGMLFANSQTFWPAW